MEQKDYRIPERTKYITILGSFLSISTITQYTLTQHLVVISIFQVVVVQDRSYVGLLMVLPFGVVIITQPIALELVR